MSNDSASKKTANVVWPGRKLALRRLLLIAAVLFPCTYLADALLVKNWDILENRDAESFRHLREAGTAFVAGVAVVFLLSLLPQSQRVLRWRPNPRAMRRGLIAIAWLVTVIALFYGEEDWRGRHAWNKYGNALTAQGEQLDFRAFVPKTIPDAENFAAIPEIKSWFDRGHSNSWSADKFALASTSVSDEAGELPRHITDLVAWQMAFNATRTGRTDHHPTNNFRSGKLDLDSRAQAAPAVLEDLEPLESMLEQFRAASSRPESRYPVVYDLNNPWGILLPHLANIKAVCLRLDLRACAELAAGQSDRALEDVKLELRMGDSLNQEPFLISYLVRLAVFHIEVHSVWEGLAEHRWSDAQLKELQQSLARYDFIADMKPPFDGERAAGILTADLLADGRYTFNLLTDDRGSGASAADAFGRIMPRGWFDLEKLNYCRLFNLQLDGSFDAQKKRVFPSRLASNAKALDQAFAGRNPVTTILIRHQLLAAVMLPALGKVSQKGAFGQVAADETVLACALERHRLARGQYPDSLDALSPEFISAPPQDVISGEPYKYHRTGNSFTLYSIGWNEEDDGGHVALKGKSHDLTEGDWVWEYPEK